MSLSEIAAVDRQFEDAARKGDLDRLASLYTPDAIALPPDGPVVKGREAIKQMWGTDGAADGAQGRPAPDTQLRAGWRHRLRVGEATLALSRRYGRREVRRRVEED